MNIAEDQVDKWPYEVGTYSPALVQLYCVQDAEWQKLRLWMKGKSTQVKLITLQQYRNECIMTGNYTERQRIQIDNYINALKRGGQLNMKREIVR